MTEQEEKRLNTLIKLQKDVIEHQKEILSLVFSKSNSVNSIITFHRKELFEDDLIKEQFEILHSLSEHRLKDLSPSINECHIIPMNEKINIIKLLQ